MRLAIWMFTALATAGLLIGLWASWPAISGWLESSVTTDQEQFAWALLIVCSMLNLPIWVKALGAVVDLLNERSRNV